MIPMKFTFSAPRKIALLQVRPRSCKESLTCRWLTLTTTHL